MQNKIKPRGVAPGLYKQNNKMESNEKQLSEDHAKHSVNLMLFDQSDLFKKNKIAYKLGI